MMRMEFSREDLQKVRDWMYRNARPVDLARWKYHFDGADNKAVLEALAAYQNEDGGFGHALEADSWNPESSPIQTWCATEILREVGMTDRDHPIIRGILSYLASGAAFRDGFWLAEIPSNNDHPHAPWWGYNEEGVMDWGYNPTATLAGFILRFGEEDSELYDLAERIAACAIGVYLEDDRFLDMHELSNFIRLSEYLVEADVVYDLQQTAFKDKLKLNVTACLTQDTSTWRTDYVCRPSQFFKSLKSPYFEGNEALALYEADYLIETRNEDGVWDITWKWGSYDREFAISENFWKADLVIRNLRYLKGFGRIEGLEQT